MHYGGYSVGFSTTIRKGNGVAPTLAVATAVRYVSLDCTIKLVMDDGRSSYRFQRKQNKL